VTLTLTSDELESHIAMNVSSTLTNTTNTTIWFVAALSLWMYVYTDGRTYGWTYVWMDVRTDGRTYGWTDTFTGFIRSSLRRWPKNGWPHVWMHPTCPIISSLL